MGKQAACAEKDTKASRNTIQRGLVFEAVKELHNHPTSSEVYDVVARKHPSISRATVYRNLDVLTGKGQVSRVDILHGAARYDANTMPHYHAKCRQCERVFDVDLPYQAGLEAEVEKPRGFVIEGHQIVFQGVCPGCQSQAEGMAVGPAAQA